jgi:hypothetical protein
MLECSCKGRDGTKSLDSECSDGDPTKKSSESAFKFEETCQETTFEQFIEFLMKQAQIMGSAFSIPAYQDENTKLLVRYVVLH